MNLKAKVRDIEDFPQKGILFRDITTLIGDGEAYRYVVDAFAEKIEPLDVDAILVLDARGFLVGPPVAYKLRKGIVPVRKKGKLPAETYQVEFDLEYGSDAFEIHQDALKPGMKVAILDDLLATGGSAGAACRLAEMAGAQVVFVGFLIELSALKGREKLEGYNVFSLITY
jgi:adenine phosphoribosyltransferase